MKFLPLLFLLACYSLWAKDILWMNNGDRLTGNIEEVTEQSVRHCPALQRRGDRQAGGHQTLAH